MSDAEMWRELHRQSQHRRAENKVSSTEILAAHPEIQVVKKMDGVHLIVSHGGKTIDFWPTTGKWIDRGERGVHHRGVFPLLKRLGIEHVDRPGS